LKAILVAHFLIETYA